MIDQRRPEIWPWLCVMLFFITLHAVSPPTWQSATASPRTAKGIGCKGAGCLGSSAASPQAVDVSQAESLAARSLGARCAGPQPPAAAPHDNAWGTDEASSAESANAGQIEEPLMLVSSEIKPRVGMSFQADSIASCLDLDAPLDHEVDAPLLRPAQEAPHERVGNAARVPSRSPDRELQDAATGASAPDLSPVPSDEPPANGLRPEALLKRLAELKGDADLVTWSARVRDAVQNLTSAPLLPEETAALLAELRRLVDEGSRHAVRKGIDQQVSGDWLRAQHAVRRRLDIWQGSLHLNATANLREGLKAGPAQLASTVAGLEGVLARGTHQQKWREYLLVDALNELAGRSEPVALDQRTLARRVLRRLDKADEDAARRKFLAAAPLDELAAQLRSLNDVPVERHELLTDLERFEQTMLPSDAHYLADSRLRLAASSNRASQALAQFIDDGYRACNLRVAVTGDLLNRLIPPQAPSHDPVHTTIVGVPVRGQSQTQAEVSLRLIPDPKRVRLEMVAQGNVDATTTASSGPVEVFSQSNSRFEARKPLEFTLQGITFGPAQATASSDQHMRGLRTEYDNIPILGSFVRNKAKDEHAAKRGQAKWESEQQIRERAERQFDETSEPRLAAANQRIREQMLAPLKRLGLQDSPVLFETTAQRVVMRARLATDEQLAAHSPRPQAPADSLASMQIHQSALNNVLDQLELSGRTFQAADLMHHVAKKFNRDNPSVGEEAPASLWMTFADRDPITARCDNGRVQLTLRLDELTLEGKKWRDVIVRVNYSPEPQGNSVVLVREGTVSLSAERLNTRSQLMLRGLFSRIFAEEGTWTLMGDLWAKNPALQNTEFSHFSVDDGWINVALTPIRRAPATARKP